MTELQKYEKFKKGCEVAATKVIIEEDNYEDEEEMEGETHEEEIVIKKEPAKSKGTNKSNKKFTVSEEEVEFEEVEILTSKEEAIVKKAMSVEEEKVGLTDMLTRFKNYISGKDFDTKCSEAEKKSGIKKAAVKNRFIRNVLGTIADVLNLTIAITGDVIVGAVKFLNSIIQSVVNFTAGTIHKLINLLTLNCGSINY